MGTPNTEQITNAPRAHVEPNDASTKYYIPEIVEPTTLPTIPDKLLAWYKTQYPDLSESELYTKYLLDLSSVSASQTYVNPSRTKTPYEKEQAKLGLRMLLSLELAKKDELKKTEALKVATGVLSMLSPSTYVKLFGNVEMSAAKEFLTDILLDPTTYASFGIIPVTKYATREGAEKLARELIEGSLKAHLRNSDTYATLITKDIVDTERNNILAYLTNSNYGYALLLKLAGFSDLLILDRISSMIYRTGSAQIHKVPDEQLRRAIPGMDDVLGTSVQFKGPGYTDQIFYTNADGLAPGYAVSAVLEELLHTAHAGGMDPTGMYLYLMSHPEVVRRYERLLTTPQKWLSPEEIAEIPKAQYAFGLMDSGIGPGSLHNDKAWRYNSQWPLLTSFEVAYDTPEMMKYYNKHSELWVRMIRARLALLRQLMYGGVITEPEFLIFTKYANTPNLEEFVKKGI